MESLYKLTREQIEQKYQDMPIYIVYTKSNEGRWYIVADAYGSMPLHLLSESEVDLYEQDNSIIDGIDVCGSEDGYLMWIYFGNGWDAYGYYE